MAGHSKWANIKHRKAAQDAKRGKVFTKLIRELQTDSLTGEMIHIDFQRILMDQKVKVQVPIELHGEAAGGLVADRTPTG